MRLTQLFAAAAFAAAPMVGKAAVIVSYDFNDSTPGVSGALGVVNLSADDGTTGTLALGGVTGVNGGSSTNNYGSFAGSILQGFGADANTSGQALAITGTSNNNATITMAFDASTFSNALTLNFASQHTATGYSTLLIEGSTDGGTTYSTVTTVTSLPTSFASFNFALPAGFSSTATDVIRFTVSGATSTTGNIRLDNISISDAPVPEPTSAAVVASLGLLGLRRRKA